MDKSKPKTMLGRQPVRLEGSLILILSHFNKAKRLTRRGIELVLKIGYLWFHIFGQRALGIWSLGKSFLDAVFIKIFRQFANWLRCRRDKKFTCKECYVIQKAYIFQGVRKGGEGRWFLYYFIFSLKSFKSMIKVGAFSLICPSSPPLRKQE